MNFLPCGAHTVVILAGFSFLVSALPTAAHHSAAIYDMERTVDIVGTVAEYDWANPHVYIDIDVVADSGEVITWEIEAYPPAVMRRMGWTETTFRPGDSIRVSGNPTRSDARPGIYPQSIEAAGQALFRQAEVGSLFSNPSVVPERGAESLAGTWETLANMPLIVSFYSPAFELTKAGTAAVDAYDESTMLPSLQCIPYSSPLLMIDPDFKEIELLDSRVIIRGGFAVAERTVHMNTDSHDGVQPSLQGHSIGHWDGDTLVIDTAAFADHRIGNGYRGVQSGSRKRLLERLSLFDDGKRLRYAFELHDPDYLEAPVSGEAQWVFRPGLTYFREDCELDNARRFTLE